MDEISKEIKKKDLGIYITPASKKNMIVPVDGRYTAHHHIT